MRVRLNRQILVERQTKTTDATYGTDVVTWEPLSYLAGSPAVGERFWAELQDEMPSRSESIRQGASVSRNAVRCRLRWRDDIDSSMRVTVYGDSNTVYSIVGGPAEVGGRKQFIELLLERYSS